MALSELLTVWEPRDVATALDWVEEQNDAARDAAKGR